MSTQVDFFYFVSKYLCILEDEVGESLDFLGFGFFLTLLTTLSKF